MSAAANPDRTPTWTPELLERVRASALAEGFDLVGVAAAPASAEAAGQQTASRFSGWVESGRAGEMDYLKRRDEAGELLRRSARVAMPWARSVVICGFSYNLGGPRSIDPADADTGWIARYAWLGNSSGDAADYHDVLLERLRGVEAALSAGSDCQTRCYVDTGPLLERDFAARAGIGWVGKNTCVLNQQLGSWLLLAALVCSLEVPDEVVALPAPDRCGSCTRCLDACPTGALVAPREMDASLCISYLTIEKKGAIAPELREAMGRQVFGCDICQEVCPWNAKAPIVVKQDLRLREELVNPALAWLAELDAAAFRGEFRGSPLERTRRKRLLRNVAIAMGNSGDREFLPRLETWAQAEDATLAESARWSIARLGGEFIEDVS